MSDFSARRPLALTASIATSVAVAAGMIAPTANATPASPDGAAKLTLSNGTAQAGAPASGTVNGAAVGLNYVAKGGGAKDAAWSPDGSRAAWVDAQNNIQVDPPFSPIPQTQITPPNTAGAVRSHPTWIDNGSRVLWSEQIGSGNKVLKAADANGLGKDKAGAQIVNDFIPAGVPAGDLEFPDAAGSILAFQWRPAGGGPTSPTSIYVVDLSQPGVTAYKVADGFHPSVSADGKTIAYLQNTAAVDQIYTVGSANPGATLAAPKQITNQPAANPHSFAHPVWAPDGKSIVFEWLDGAGNDLDTQSVPIGATPVAAPYTQLVAGTPVTGLPAFQPQKKNIVLRFAGTDRLDTAAKVSQAHWKTAGSATSTGVQAKAVVLSRSDEFADALGGSALAAKVGGPLLLTPTAGLNAAAAAEIQRVLGPGDGVKTVYVLGGIAALSPAVETALTGLHYKVQRVAGPDRFSTAIAIANTITNNQAPDYILVATGRNYPDALSAGAAAGAIDAHTGKTAVVVLTSDAVMPKPTVDYLAPLNNRTVLNADHSRPANFIEVDTIGQQAQYAMQPSLKDPNAPGWIPPGFQSGGYFPFSGADRYATSQMVAREFFPATGTVGLATGVNWADALSGGALMGTLDGPVLLIPPTGPAGGAAAWLSQSSGQLDKAIIFGGKSAVADPVDQTVGGMIGGPAGVDFPAWNPNVG